MTVTVALLAALSFGAQVAPTITAISAAVNIINVTSHWQVKYRAPFGKPGPCYRTGIAKVVCK